MREMMLRTAQFKNIKTKGKGLAIILTIFYSTLVLLVNFWDLLVLDGNGKMK